jgi:hypothetical protein
VSKIEYGATHTDGLEIQGGFTWAQSINILDPSCPNDMFAIDLHAIGIPKKKKKVHRLLRSCLPWATHARTYARTRLCTAVALSAHSHVVIESSGHARSCTRYGTEGSKLRPIQKTHPFCKTLCFLRNAVLCIQSRHRTTMALLRGKGI